MLPPKRFKQNTTKATEIKRNGTEAIGIDQDGVAKSIDIEVLMNKGNVGLDQVDNTSDADKPVSTAQQAELDLKIPLAQKGQASGVATLGSDGKIPSAQIPSIALVDVFTVDSEAEMLALDAEQGDMAIRSDTSQVFVLSASPATTIENWIELSALKALVDASIVDLAGAGRTTETVKGNADALTTLNGDDTTAGSVLKSIKEQAQKGDFAPTVASGIESETLEEAVNEVGVDVEAVKGTDWTDETVKGNAEDIATLNADATTAGSVAYDIKQLSDALKGVDYTEGSLKTHEDRLDTLEGADTVSGSVAKTVKDTAQDATFTDASGLDSTTLKDAINEIYAEKAVANGLASLDATGKIPVAQLPVSAMEFKGGWDASSGAYPLTPDVGDFWTVSVAGTTEGVKFDAGDAIVYNGATWDKINKVEIAEEVSYDNSSSGLIATNVQDAIDEVEGRIDDAETALTTLNADAETEGSVAKTVKDGAQDATYDNTGTCIEATTLKTAITELDARLVDAEAHVYGLNFNETTGVCTRLLDAVGLTVGAPDGVNPIVSDFDSCYPWSAMHHVKIALDGTRKEPFEDGYDTFDGEMMRHTPAYWYKDYRSGGHRYLYIADKKKAGFLYQKSYDIASFDASKVGTEYRSRVGEAPKTNESYTQFITGFYAQGDGKWSMYDQLHSEFMLSVIEAGTMNHKGAYGRGINSGMPYGSTAVYLLTADTVAGNDVVLADSAQPFYVGMTVQIGIAYTNNSVAQNRVITNVVRAGGVLTLTLDGDPFSAIIGNSCVTWGQSVPQAQFDTMGDGSGYILQHESANRSHVCYRGIWDLWGNVWQFYAGFMRYNGRYYGCTDPTKYNITNPVGADGWVDLGIGEYAENGYQQIREGVVIDGGTIDVPVTWGATAGSETFYSAYLYYFSSAYSGARVLLLGGYWRAVGYVSLVCSIGSVSPSDTDFYIGSRLIRS